MTFKFHNSKFICALQIFKHFPDKIFNLNMFFDEIQLF